MVRVKPKYVVWEIFDIEQTGYGYNHAKMLMKDFERSVALESPNEPYAIVSENGTKIFYLNTPVGCYRIKLIEDDP